MEDLAQEEVGINEVESMAWKRSANREVKKGKRRPRNRGRYSDEVKRDSKYVKAEMRERARQAKEDWQETKEKFMKRKSQMLREAGSDKEKNAIKRMIEKLKKTKSCWTTHRSHTPEIQFRDLER